MSVPFDPKDHPHRRYNPLLQEHVLVSPHRAKRPWLGQQESVAVNDLPAYDPKCYLCPGNTRVTGAINDAYTDCFVFPNDYPALLTENIEGPPISDLPKEEKIAALYEMKPERGIAKVICFSPKHNLTLPQLSVENITQVVTAWQQEYASLGSIEYINYVQIFENKGSVMGCSNPHPHCQIWAQSSLPSLVAKTQKSLEEHYSRYGSSLLADYLENELKTKERVVWENDHFVLLVPFWATWPYEVMILSRRHFQRITDMTHDETVAFAEILKMTTIKYDNIFSTSFPYSAGIHQAPTDGKDHKEWHFHMHFFPPLLRSATVKKFMVGYEMMAEPQRDMTAEQTADILKKLPETHYLHNLGKEEQK